MARQKGPNRFSGGIGNLSFYENKVHGDIVREKGGPTREQIKKRKSMAEVRDNNEEFGRASRYGSLLRNAFRMLIVHCREYSMSRRLQGLMTAIVKMDAESERGKRDIVKAHLVQLQGFELNETLSYKKFFKKDVDVEVQDGKVVASGKCTLPRGIGGKAGFYKVISVAASIDFKKKKMVNSVKESELLPSTGSRQFLFEHSVDESHCLFYGMAICFYKKTGIKFALVSDEDMKAGFISFVG